MTFDDLLKEADGAGLIVKEKPLLSADGRIYRNRIAISEALSTDAEKACILAEELGHYYTTSGDILTRDTFKQEHKARLWAFDKLIGLSALVEAFKHGCRTRYEIAQYLGVTEEFLTAAVTAYGAKLDGPISVGEYAVLIAPSGNITIWGPV